MSVQNQTVKNVYAGNGSTTVFPYTFALNEEDGEYVGVYVTNEENVSEITTNYTINTTAKTVTYPRTGEPLPEDRKITILRELPNEQNLNLENLGPFFADDVEGEMDREVMMIQQLAEQVARAVKVDVTDDLPSASVIYDINHVREYKDDAETAASNSASSATASAASAAEAAGSATESANSATEAAGSAAQSANSATASSNSAAQSANSATASANSAAESAGYLENVATSASNAEASALQAAEYAAASAAHATTSENYARAASDSASRAANTVTSAESIASTAAGYAANAAASATESAGYATNAAASAVTSSNYAAAAGTSATAAQDSAAAAALSAGTATTQAELASGYADDAADSADDAAASATAAANSAGAAADSATEAEEANTEAKYYAKVTMDKIAEAAIGYPHQEGTLTYDGTEQMPTWDVFYEPQKMTVTGTTSATNAGTYTITMTPKPGYYWWDTNTTTARTQTWTIGRQAIANVPSQSVPIPYDGAEHSPTWANYDSTKMTIGGTTAATAAGTYTATFTPLSNYKWSDGTTTAIEVTWTIGKMPVSVPTVTDTTKTYSGAAQGPTIGTYNPALIEVSGTSATNAGSYAVVFHLKDTDNTAWTDESTADKSVAWTISPKTVTIPTVTGTSFTYNGAAQGPTISAFSATEITQTGTASATNVGSYTVTLSLTSATNYVWSDNTTAAKSTSWSIAKLALAVPTLSGTSKTFTGASQSPTISSYNTTYISATGDLSGTNVGSYTITFSLLDTTNTIWTDNTTAAKTDSWTISKLSLAVPTLSNTSKTYNRSSQAPTISTYDTTLISATGDLSATNAGSYTITFSLLDTDNTQWTDTTTAAKTASWSIAVRSITAPYLTNTSKTYNGSSQSPTQNGYSSTYITRTGTQSATNAGDYAITYTLKYPGNTKWSDDTTAAKVCPWSIAGKSVTIPTMTDKSKTYTGSAQSPTISSFSATEVTQGGTESATNAGTYTVTWSLTSTTNYKWSDNTTAAKSDTWTIAKAAGYLSLSKSTVSLNTSQLTDTVTVTRSGDGAISATSSDTSIATVSVSGTTVTVTAVANGSATVTVSVAAGTNYLAPSNATVSVACQLIPALNDATWAQISEIAQAGTGDAYWDVGDVKMIELNGKIGNFFTATNLSLGVFILDFNHPMNGTAENNIIFGGFKTAVTGGVDVALCDSGYGSQKPSGLYFNMNHVTQSNPVNYGGWKGSDLRYDILGATSTQPSQYNQQKNAANVGYDATAATLTSPRAGTFLAALPSYLRSKIRLWTRYIDAVGGETNAAANIKETVDAVTLLAESEIFASRKYANSYEQNYNTRMAYYTAGNSTIKYKHSESSTAVVWWECSPFYSGAIAFCSVSSGGDAGSHRAADARGLAPAFKV